VAPSRQRRCRATGAGERGNIVISHTTQQHGVVGGRGISKHPLNGSSGPGTGSASRGQLSRLSIGRIGLHARRCGQPERQMGGCAQQTAAEVSCGWWCLVERDTAADTHSPPPTPTAHRDGRRPPTIRSGPPEAAQSVTVSCGLGEGGWATIDRACSQPRRRCSSSRLCRPRRHGQACLLANKFSALIYAEPPLYH
jgi:hypothetical protein